MADLKSRVMNAIHTAQAGVRWRPGSAARHLQKRKLRGHLPADATLDDYECIILTVVHNQETDVYVYWHSDVPYVALVAVIEDCHWLVMFDLKGRIESAFVVERPDRYLSKPAFVPSGTIGEVRT